MGCKSRGSSIRSSSAEGFRLTLEPRDGWVTAGYMTVSFRVWGLGFRGLGFRVWGLGFGVWGLGFRVLSLRSGHVPIPDIPDI